ncbi:MAG: hypothetical protein ACK4VZ_08945 [Paracoccaceae bacterium]
MTARPMFPIAFGKVVGRTGSTRMRVGMHIIAVGLLRHVGADTPGQRSRPAGISTVQPLAKGPILGDGRVCHWPLEQAVDEGAPIKGVGLTHRSGCGTQYLSTNSAERFTELGI